MNGKGSRPRNCFSKQFKDNYSNINWKSKKRPNAIHNMRFCEYCGKETLQDVETFECIKCGGITNLC